LIRRLLTSILDRACGREPVLPEVGLGDSIPALQREMGERVPTINNGGCGLFASLLSEHLDRLNVPNDIVFLTEVEPYKLVGRATCLMYGHDVLTDEMKVNVAPYHAMVRVRNANGTVVWVDGLGSYDEEPIVDGRRLNSVEIPRELMPTVLERGGWNERFCWRRKAPIARGLVAKHMGRTRPYIKETNT